MISAISGATALRIVVAARNESSRARLVDQLTAYGHAVVAQATTVADVVRHTVATCPDVLLLDTGLLTCADVDVTAHLARANPRPGVVLLSDEAEPSLGAAELARTGAAALLVTPVRSAVLENTVRMAAAQARVLAALGREAGAARRQVEERKLLERAKGILMRRIGGSDADAEQLLERSSRQEGDSLPAVARSVLLSEPRRGTRRM